MGVYNQDYLRMIASPEVVKRGIAYYESGAVKDIKFEGELLHAVVKGSEDYDVFLQIKDNFIKGYRCTCPAYFQFDGACKHVIAVFCHIFENGLPGKNNNKHKAIKEDYYIEDYVLLELLKNTNSEIKKQEVRVEYYFEFKKYNVHDFVCSMHMRIGDKRLYVLKDIKEFIEKIENNLPFSFGKLFNFNPLLHEFSKEDAEVLNIIKELYGIERSISIYSAPNVFLDGKYVNLNYNFLMKVAKALGNKPVNMISPFEKLISFEVNDLPFNIKIEKNNDGIYVKPEGEMGLPLDREERIILKDDKVYLLNHNEQVFPIVKGLYLKDRNELKFTGENQHKLFSVLPRLQEFKNIELSEDLKHAIERKPLKFKIHIEGYKKGIAVDVKFIYGEQEFNPFTKESLQHLIVRDYEKEMYILKLFEDTGFSIERGRAVLQNEEKLYIFIKEVLPNLTQMGEVYYASDVKHLFSIKTPKIRSSISYLYGNLLEIKTDFEDIDVRAAEEILHSIKEKKKYFRLKDGSFISLEENRIKKLSELLEDVSREDIEQNRVNLSKYRFLGFLNNVKDKSDVPFEQAEEFERVIDNIVNSKHQKIEPPESLKGILREYQVTGFKWLKVLAENGLGGILADDMGLGKTLQAISFLLSAKESKISPQTSLIVAPSSLIFNWENEIARFAPQLKTAVVSGSVFERKKVIKKLNEYDVIITSYPLLRNDLEFYIRHNFYCVILDEAQHIKNFDSLNAKSVKKLKSNVRFALTGTPIENSLAELWSIFDFIMPGYLYSYKKFNEYYQRPIVEGNNEDLEELKKLISPFILRRTKNDVLKELPEKTETTLMVDMTPQQKKIYLSYLKNIKGELEERIEREGFEKSKMHIFSGLLRLRQICCHPALFIENYKGTSGKMELLEELLQELMDSGRRVLIFSQFTSMLSLIRKMLEEMNIKYAYLDGNTCVNERKVIVDDFNNGCGRVFLLSLKAGGVGLNLTSADTVIHFDPWWNPAVENQASDRAHRIGQKNNVQVFRLITKGTIEEKINELQMKKKDLINSVVIEGELFINSLTKEELMELFRI